MAELTQQQFETIATLMQSKDPAKKAAQMVLVEGKAIKDAVAATGMFQSSVSKTVKRYRNNHRLICEGYGLEI